MRKLSLFGIILLLSNNAFAVKKALVIGGASTQVPTGETSEEGRAKHEFARSTARTALGPKAKGYDVETLFDVTGLSITGGDIFNRTPELQSEMKRDYDKLKSIGATAATEESVLTSLRRIRDELGPGDVFDFTINAHGYRFCKDESGEYQQVKPEVGRVFNADSSCVHKIGLNDPTTGATVHVETKKIQEILAEIDAKGVKTDLNIISCHSGQAQDLFRGMNNTCVTFAASGNNVGISCMPTDPIDDPLVSQKATGDMIQASKFIHIADELLADPYFSDDPCTKKLTDHYRKNKIGGDNLYDLFMSARKFDQTLAEPSISSQTSLDYFRQGIFSATYANLARAAQEKMCRETISNGIDELLNFGESISQEFDRREYEARSSALLDLVDEYNRNIDEQISLQARFTALKRAYPTATNKDLALQEIQNMGKELKALQDATLEISTRLMSKERLLVDFANEKFLKDAIEPADPCKKKIEG